MIEISFIWKITSIIYATLILLGVFKFENNLEPVIIFGVMIIMGKLSEIVECLE